MKAVKAIGEDHARQAKAWWLLLAVTAAVVLISGCSRRPITPPPPFEGGSDSDGANLIRAWSRAPGGNLSFDHITLEAGLSHTTVYDVVQDDLGFIWIATADGLNRYDGYGMSVYRHRPDDPSSLSNNTVSRLLVDSSGRLWIGTAGGGLDLFLPDIEQFRHYGYDSNDPNSLSSPTVLAIAEDRQGQIWVGTPLGLNRLDIESGTFRRYLYVEGTMPGTYSTNQITAIQPDLTGQLWLGTEAGLLTFDPAEESFSARAVSTVNGEANRIRSLLMTDGGLLWIGTSDGLHRLDTASGFMRHFLHQDDNIHSLGHPFVTDLLLDPSGRLWVSTQAGLDLLSRDERRFTHWRHVAGRPDSLRDGGLQSLFLDRSGIMWIGTRVGGVDILDPFKIKFRHLNAEGKDPPQLSHPLVRAILEDRQGLLWVGTAEGLDVFDRERNLKTHYEMGQGGSAIVGQQVLALYEDSRGTVWVGTSSGLSAYHPDTRSFRHYWPDANSYYSVGGGIQAIGEDRHGFLWFGTLNRSLDRYDPESGRFQHNFQAGANWEPGLAASMMAQNTILAIHQDVRDDVLWAGTAGGLARIDLADRSQLFLQADLQNLGALSDNTVYALHQQADGALWVGTAYGLNRYDPETGLFRRYLEEDGLPNNTVVGILQDDAGGLWISTLRGLARLDTQTETFRTFDTGDGLQSLAFNAGAAFRSPSGEIFFGGVNGMNSFFPDDILENPYVPPVVITELQLMNRPVPIAPGTVLEKSILRTERLRPDRHDNVISFELASLHYGQPESNQYAYILEGFDEDWNLSGSRRFVNYTNLPAGSYTFRAIASNNDGVWNTEGVSLQLIIPRPMLLQPGILALAAVALVGLVAGAYRLRVRNMAARTRLLKEEVAERTAEIEQRRQIAEGLREILINLNANRSAEESLHFIVSQAARLTEAEDAVIFRHDPEEPVHIVATNSGGRIRYSAGPALLARLEPWIRETIFQKEPFVLSGPAARSSLAGNELSGAEQESRALLGIPLFLGETIYGGLILFYGRFRTFASEDLELGFTFAEQAALAIANDRLRRQAERIAVASERNRLARDLHDAVTQTLFSASLIAEALPSLWADDPEEGRNLLRELRQMTRGALAEMRTLLLELRPASLEEAALPDLLQQLGESLTGRTGIPVTLAVEHACNFEAPVRIALYRIAQEALNNVVKHARATEVSLSVLACSPDSGILLVVSDNGRGFDPRGVSGDHLGLKIIRERAQSIGAKVDVDSYPGAGTRITITYPFGKSVQVENRQLAVTRERSNGSNIAD